MVKKITAMRRIIKPPARERLRRECWQAVAWRMRGAPESAYRRRRVAKEQAGIRERGTGEAAPQEDVTCVGSETRSERQLRKSSSTATAQSPDFMARCSEENQTVRVTRCQRQHAYHAPATITDANRSRVVAPYSLPHCGRSCLRSRR